MSTLGGWRTSDQSPGLGTHEAPPLPPTSLDPALVPTLSKRLVAAVPMWGVLPHQPDPPPPIQLLSNLQGPHVPKVLRRSRAPM